LKYNPAQFYYPTTALSAKEVEGKYDTKFRNPKEIFFASLNVAKNFFFWAGDGGQFHFSVFYLTSCSSETVVNFRASKVQASFRC
jgi:hypothetical protein